MELRSKLELKEETLDPGVILDGKYEILCKIGRGSLGAVYKARALSRERDIAIKMLTHASPALLGDLRHAAATLGQVKHRAVVRIDDFGKTAKWGPYLAMAYVPGVDLATFAGTGKVSVRQAVDVVLALCSGISACHLQAVLHRALTPSNVRITQSGDWQDRVKILDAGLALPIDRAAPAAEALRYVAPELLRREAPSKPCDQYGLAALLYLLLTGRAPFENLDGQELVRAKLEGAYLACRLVQPRCPPVLQGAVEKGLDLDPKRRFPTVDDFALAILSEASPAVQRLWRRSPADAKLPVGLSPGEQPAPIQPATPPGEAGPVAPIASPVEDEMSATMTDPVPASPARPKGERSPPSAPAPRLTESPPRPPLTMLLVFTWGVAVGALLATGVFLSLLAYQRYEQRQEASLPARVPPATPSPPSAHGP